MSAKLLTNLWNATSGDEIHAVLKTLSGGYTMVPINNTSNNSGTIELATSPQSAMVEGITNALDATIVHHRNENRFNPMPTNVHEALEQIHQPCVHILVNSNKAIVKKPIVTLIDQGTGMTDQQMARGVLAIGSDYKPTDPTQHGNYGMGGATLFARNDASIIVTRIPDSDHYTFTVVWKLWRDDGSSSYVYATNPDKRLFTASAKSLEFVYPDSNDLVTAVQNNNMVLPLHGTVRRQIDMDLEFNRGRQSNLYRSLATRLFGSHGKIALTNDSGQATMILQGLREELNTRNVDEYYDDASLQTPGPMLLAHIAPKLVMLPDPNTELPVTFETWVVKDWIHPQGYRVTYLRDRLEGQRDSTSGIIVTLNGQTHMRIYSGKLFRDAGLPYLAEHTIVHVVLDNIAPRNRVRLMSSNRESLTKQGEEWIRSEVERYVASHGELIDLNSKMTPDIQDSDVEDDRTMADAMNQIMNDPLIGNVIWKSNTNGKGGNNSIASVSNGGGAKFVASEPPTFISVDISPVIANHTCWVKIKTDAANRYSENLTITYPDFLTPLNEDAPIVFENGRLTIGFVCNASVALGSHGFIDCDLTIAASSDDHNLHGSCAFWVVEERDIKPPKIMPPKTSSSALPKIEWFMINKDSPSFTSVFPGVESQDAFWNYRVGVDSCLEMFINTDFTALHDVRQMMAKQSLPVEECFFRSVKMGMIATAMLSCRNEEDFGTNGAMDHRTIRLLCDVGRMLIVTHALHFKDNDLRNIIERRAMKAEQRLLIMAA